MQSYWQSLRGYELEEALEVLFQSASFATSRQGGRGDEGVDLLLTRGTRRVVVQSKGWATRVGPEVVRELVGTKHIQRANEAWLVTVDGLTDAALTLARRQKARVLDPESLAEIARGEFGGVMGDT